ncbi:MAG: acyl-CoA dehydrogenase [Pseudomonadales bacterium]|jgi:alkylation response protein AidB-like acyl-CoA dehydrogenase|uniref:acyl-CoA dehydrogenase C-terminal domain-containing protein n=1 Tax=unclassified Ketobacter TaxID=2639109 RepID=UPI000C9339A9|nr:MULTISPECIES: acyl-CoA dehydrogenase C-terminal domain-containing protein [unclassified Ketobacter]MAA58934.1 acyl-CoA dehydrogenase [Pseudomonadales bacterium]MEC8810372.1 acyl-CoA dehydrogenase C-terminal domain-containing protein [Pseudomonadota bacterium]TNC90119.1 MAG: acyl-CoA dehydrogenase [Alcanivorax sp.]HAG94468.1 acyl-CoA dehydrogenase [Gammaproteobacteria bacterium]MAQ23647.1 acyl-CoA dehydrogenase [Pseudomonadales bacterium]|tara:strand:- start:3423 stop:5225 length:1803 start_codon:yes stop_codon:yes gene_type:complete
MPEYKAPRRDIQFVMHEVLKLEDHYKALRGDEEVNRDLIDAILEEGAKFCENELAPINRTGDEEGCGFDNGVVTTPKGFKEAYQKYVEGGWPALSAPIDEGGQGLPNSLGIVMSEMVGTANWSWGMYPGLSHGAIKTLESHGTTEQKEQYLTRLISGEWTGTMCLTEPHCGTDLGILRTKAEPNADGSYSISGTKIFISAGDHDMVDNIIHIVLARLPDAPKGTKGISLFIVPKVNVNEDGSLGEANGVSCGSIEHKMGIKASATCVLNFEGAKGYLIGPPNRGLNCMFTFMNTARIGTALQGVAAAEGSYQGALTYAKERLAMRALSGPKAPDKEADPIIVHPDVRRMLLTQKAFAEGGRALLYYLSMQGDIVEHGADEEAKKLADDLMAFLTPIAKAFCTETGLEAANHGVQVFGGHGFIREWGMEQIVRDTRIATLYEGTTGIQALDLLGRKVMLTQGGLLKNFTKIVHKFCKENDDNAEIAEFIEPLATLNKEWGDLTTQIGMRAMANQEEIGAAAVDYLMYSGYITLAYFWAVMAKAAKEQLAAGTSEEGFYTAKVQTAKFYFKRILPRTKSLVDTVNAGLDSLMDMEVDNFGFY